MNPSPRQVNRQEGVSLRHLQTGGSRDADGPKRSRRLSDESRRRRGSDLANARTIFETAAFTGVDTGEYIVSATRCFSVGFTLDKTTEITGIGGQFGGFPSGMIFGAIVSLPSPGSLPDFTPSTIATNSLADVEFAAPSATTDLTEKLDVTLSAGSYGLVFGWGAFGAEVGTGSVATTTQSDRRISSPS
jgi:hypothetical protein